METKFKAIKYLDQKEYRNLYEMSEDGLIVRNIETQEVLVSDNSLKRMYVLQVPNGSAAKAFGTKSLYWASWGKALPGSEVKPKAATSKKVANIGSSSRFIARQKELLSKYQHGELEMLLHKRRLLGGSANGQEITEDRKPLGSIILFNEAHNTVLLRLDSQNWRDGYWFYNVDTRKYIKFEKAVHKPAYGDVSVIWPEEITTLGQ